VDASDSREMGGTGLGLAICRSIVQQHGGTIWAQRNPARGVSMCVRLPRLQRTYDVPVTANSSTGAGSDGGGSKVESDPVTSFGEQRPFMTERNKIAHHS